MLNRTIILRKPWVLRDSTIFMDITTRAKTSFHSDFEIHLPKRLDCLSHRLLMVSLRSRDIEPLGSQAIYFITLLRYSFSFNTSEIKFWQFRHISTGGYIFLREKNVGCNVWFHFRFHAFFGRLKVSKCKPLSEKNESQLSGVAQKKNS